MSRADATNPPHTAGPAEGAAATHAQPPPPLASAMRRAALIATGSVRAVEADAAIVALDRVLQPEGSRAGDTVRVTWKGGTLTPGQSGVWVLGEGDPRPVLTPEGPSVPLRQVERVLAGLPAIDEAPTSEVLRRLGAEAEVVIFARILADGGDCASVTAVESLKGDLPANTLVTRGPQDDAPGGPWTFATGAPSFGVLFLRFRDGGWQVMNPTDPTLYDVGVVHAALAPDPDDASQEGDPAPGPR